MNYFVWTIELIQYVIDFYMLNSQFLHCLIFFSINVRSQIRTALKKKAFEDAGLPVRQISVPASQLQLQQVPQTHKSEVTLNMLNAAESEVDVEGLHEEVKLEFEGGDENVAS